jgi:tetratricopeptide (TPR) repeat protein
MKKRRKNPAPAPVAPPTVPAPAAGHRPRREWLLAAALVAVTCLTYLPALECEFVNLDDNVYVTHNPGLKQGLSAGGIRWAWTAVVAGHWHPLTMLSLLLDHQLFGLKPWGYHLVNLLLHLANTLLLFRCLRVLTGAIGRSAVVAGLFALHPLHVESVAWVAERKDVLGTFFVVLALRAYAWYVAAPRPGKMAVVALCLALSLLAKSMWVGFPFLLLLLDYWPLRRPVTLPASPEPAEGGVQASRATWGRLFLEKWPLFVIVAACCVATMWTQHWMAGAAVSEAARLPFRIRLGNAFVSYFEYLRQTFVPSDLAPLYPHPGLGLSASAAAGATLFVIVVSVLSCVLIRRVPYLFVGWWWYVGMMVPAIGLVQVGNLARADHFTYVPLIGVFLLLTWGAADLLRRAPLPQLAPVLAALVLALCALATRLQLVCWKDSLSMWEQTVRVTSDNFAAHREYGRCLLEKERADDALVQLDAALKLWPDDPAALQARGQALLALRRPDEAADAFQAALRVVPDLPGAHYHLGRIRFRRGDLAGAAEDLRAALDSDPRLPEAWYLLAGIALAQKDYARAEEYFDHAANLDPDRAEYRVGRGEALLRLNRSAEALVVLREAVGLNPDLPVAQQFLAVALAEAGQFPEAVAAIDRAVAHVDPVRDAAFLRVLQDYRRAFENGRTYRPD